MRDREKIATSSVSSPSGKEPVGSTAWSGRSVVQRRDQLILQDELLVRSERLLGRRVQAACFRELKPLDDFEWDFNPSIKRKQIFDLAAGRFIREHRDVLLLGPPGVGKSFLVQAIG